MLSYRLTEDDVKRLLANGYTGDVSVRDYYMFDIGRLAGEIDFCEPV